MHYSYGISIIVEHLVLVMGKVALYTIIELIRGIGDQEVEVGQETQMINPVPQIINKKSIRIPLGESIISVFPMAISFPLVPP